MISSTLKRTRSVSELLLFNPTICQVIEINLFDSQGNRGPGGEVQHQVDKGRSTPQSFTPQMCTERHAWVSGMETQGQKKPVCPPPPGT